MKSILIHSPKEIMPKWALLERQAFSILSRIPQVIQGLLTPEGEFYWPECIKDFQTFAYGNIDNAFEGFSNIPLLYLLGGEDHLLSFSQKEYDALVRQFSNVKKTDLGIPVEEAERLGRDRMLADETFVDMDWMHMAEANRLIYFLVLANPANQKNKDRIIKFAQIAFGENPAGFESNYDPEHHVFKSSKLGANGPAYLTFDKPFEYNHGMECYGLYFHDIAGVETYMDLDDPKKAELYGKEVSKRLKNCDCLSNMYSTTLATYAYLVSGEKEYKDFVLEYMSAWRERAKGYEYMPDNAGPTGIVGETIGGRFYGGHYGWTLYHGLPTIAEVMILGGENERLLNGNDDFINRSKEMEKKLFERYGIPNQNGGMMCPRRYADEGAVLEYYGSDSTPMILQDKTTDNPAYRRRKQVDGWFDYAPSKLANWQHYYAVSRSKDDFLYLKKIFGEKQFHLNKKSRTKDKGGCDLAYIAYLNGEYDTFPEESLQLALDMFYRINQFCTQKKEGVPDFECGYLPDGEAVYQMMSDIAAEFREKYGLKFDESYIYNYYQVFLINQNVPVEALLQLTTGGMSPIYNGGLLCTEARWFDMDRRRPGLCDDVAVLISNVDDAGYTMTLANTAPVAHTLGLQGGAYGEHNIVSIEGEGIYQEVGEKWLGITLSGGTVITLKVTLDRYVNQPSFDEPYGAYDRL